MEVTRLERLFKHGATIALVVLIAFGAIRYDNFLSLYNVMSVCRTNAMFALVSLGMCFVIMTGGIDLSVGAVAALASVAAAKASPQGVPAGLATGPDIAAVAAYVHRVANRKYYNP